MLLFSLWQKCCCLCYSNCCFLVKPTINNSLLFVHSITFDYNRSRVDHIYLLELLQLRLRKNLFKHKNSHNVIVLYYSQYCSNMYMIITLPTQTFFVSLERKSYAITKVMQIMINKLAERSFHYTIDCK